MNLITLCCKRSFSDSWGRCTPYFEIFGLAYFYPNKTIARYTNEVDLQATIEFAGHRDFYILHLTRGEGEPRATVHAWCIDAAGNLWTDRVLEIPTGTGVIERLGSGVAVAKTHERLWAAAYSREIFSSFCDAISSGTDSLSGGAAQLAGFYPRGAAKTFGFLRDGKAFLNGLPVHAPISNETIEWRDQLFQRIDISTGKLIEGAGSHEAQKQINRFASKVASRKLLGETPFHQRFQALSVKYPRRLSRGNACWHAVGSKGGEQHRPKRKLPSPRLCSQISEITTS